MTALSSSSVIPKSSSLYLSSGSCLKPVDYHATIIGPNKLSFSLKGTRNSSTPKRTLTVQAKYSDEPSKGSIFVGGFILGGLVAGTLGVVYAPQISEALVAAATEKEDLIKRLPKFKEQSKKLYEKIEQLHSAMDNIAHQLQSDEDELPEPSIRKPPESSDELPEPSIPKPPKSAFSKRSKGINYSNMPEWDEYI